nr:ATP-dependent DNA helicase RecG [Caloranaerobacter azorensis]
MKELNRLNTPIQFIKGVGPKRAKLLRKINIETVKDLLYYFPRAYDDRRKTDKIINVRNGEKANLKVIVVGSPSIVKPKKSLSIVKVPVRDETGLAFLIWFNQEYIKKQFKIGEVLKVSGKVKRVFNEIQIQNPIFEREGENEKIGKIVPIYPLTKNLKNGDMVKLVRNVLDEYLYYIEDIMPEYIKEKYNLCSIYTAISNIHFPKDRYSYIEAKRRLVFEELFILQLGLRLIRNKYVENSQGIRFLQVNEIDELISSLPFELTNAQKRVYKEICLDMESNRPMNRLVQGDVGSGKTIIAVLAMFKAVKSGYQAVMMAPTEILATQHYENVSNLLERFGIKVSLLVGSMSSKKKKEILDKIREGTIDIVIGTHALIQKNVKFHKLGLAITDEQHRFGVRQRAILSQKGLNPDVLVMTATPIPRTLALILYGDLDISIIDELPPGRKKVKTYVVNSSMKKRVYDFIKREINKGRQAYIVCPLIEESDTLDLQSAIKLYEELKNNIFKNLRLGLLHGKLSATEKDAIMAKFKNREIDILVSTTVIEVGVNIPNANIMVIENAERFGLSQLHQLRGRVGRGEHQSYCILINESRSKISIERMKIMEKSNNGFEISEKDLEIRGPGEFFGTKQHGLPDLKIANLFTDIKMLKIAQKEVFQLLKEDPFLELPKHSSLKQKIYEIFEEKLNDISLN